MIIVQDDPPVLQGSENEQITVEVVSKGTVHVVTFLLNKKKKDPDESQENRSVVRFPLRQAVADPYELKISFMFSGDGGGSYTVKVSGKPGGDPHEKTYKQSFGIPTDGKIYEFPIEET